MKDKKIVIPTRVLQHLWPGHKDLEDQIEQLMEGEE